MTKAGELLDLYQSLCREWNDISGDLPKLRRESAAAWTKTHGTHTETGWTQVLTRAQDSSADVAAAEHAQDALARHLSVLTVKIVEVASNEAKRVAHSIHNRLKLRSWSVYLRKPIIDTPSLWISISRWLVPAALIAASYGVSPIGLMAGVPAALWCHKRIRRKIAIVRNNAYYAAYPGMELIERLDELSRLTGLPRVCLRPPLISCLAAAYKPQLPAQSKRVSSFAGSAITAAAGTTAATIGIGNDDSWPPSYQQYDTQSIEVNPVTGLPMLAGGIDVCGNAYGTDSNWNDSWNSSGYNCGGYDGGFSTFD